MGNSIYICKRVCSRNTKINYGTNTTVGSLHKKTNILRLLLCTNTQKLKEAPEGFEPSTSSLLDWRSNQLSYGAVDILLWKHQNDTQSLSTNDSETGLGIGRSKRFLSACYMYMYISHRQKRIIFLGL